MHTTHMRCLPISNSINTEYVHTVQQTTYAWSHKGRRRIHSISRDPRSSFSHCATRNRKGREKNNIRVLRIWGGSVCIDRAALFCKLLPI